MSIPNAPTNVVATAGNQNAVVTWNLSSDNGTLIYGYKVTSTPDNIFNSGRVVEILGPTASVATIDNLTNNFIYQFKVNAINAFGISPDSNYSNAVTPFTIPDPPTNVIADPSNAFATLTWRNPKYNGGSTIYGYTATSIPEGHIASVIGTSANSVIVYGLTNGTSYTFSVVANNSAGNSLPANTVIPVIPKTVPSPPINIKVFAGNQMATVEWDPPSFTGGSPIISYTVTTYNPDSSKTLSAPTSANSIFISNLAINTTYYFTVVATNSVGSSVNSQPSPIIKTFAVPNPPTNIIASPGVNSAYLKWTAPTNVPILTRYDVYSYPAASTSRSLGTIVTNNGVIDTSMNVYNLTPNTPYAFVMIASNDSGSSSFSNPSNYVTTYNIPGAPTNIHADPSNQSALVYWTDGPTGGSPMTSYIINAIPINSSAKVTMNSKTNPGYISNLQINTSYFFTVTAVNAVGISDVSGSSTNYITTFGYPDPPTNITYDPSYNKVTLRWIQPVNTGRTNITAYNIVSSDGKITGSVSAQSTGFVYIAPPTSILIPNLINGQIYTFYVYTVNNVGQSQTYTSINAIPGTNPNPPYNVYVDPSNQSALVHWTDGFNGGSPNLSYTISSIPVNNNIYNINNAIITTGITTNPGYVTGLQIDASYVFSIKAYNYFGYSIDSSFSAPMQTFNVPGIIKNIVPFPGTRLINLLWAKPVNDGGSPITNYYINLYLQMNYPSNPIIINTHISNVNDLSYTITNLSNNTGYIITMNAINAVGISISSPPTQSITTFNYPNPPTSFSGKPGDYKVFLNWETPYNGGTNIFEYDISVNPGVFDLSVCILPNQNQPNSFATVSNLLSDTSYNFTINSVNAVGSSSKTTAITVKTNRIPDPPVITTLLGGDTEITISWDAPYNGGSKITGYIITAYANLPGQPPNIPPSIVATNFTVKNVSTTVLTGLTNGIPYNFTVVAVNGVGQSLLSDYSTFITPIHIPPPPSEPPIEYCKKVCNPIYKKMKTSTNNPNVSKRMLYSMTVNNKCSVKNNLTYDDLIRLYNFPPLDVSGINQRRVVSTTTPAFMNALF